ncbi:cyclin-dependent protein kinase inhibitor SMR13 [Pistacia vera]|uniref:cyclin-dependent protein kinase inhibitor SMR13 n=1 Tax=Pistacia vera TaxID=55513 RepID=UPI0012631746|nr:cyclin-dependent protein kinase inhibitor SMR13 [Pistacia vera]
MAPCERTRARTRSSSAAAAAPKARRTTQNKKKKQKEEKKKKEVQKASSSSTITTSSDDFSKNNNNNTNISDHHHLDSSSSPSGCSTPKAERYRIPEIMTCPPAPKKQRVVSNCSSLQRTPIAFFAPPDLELFFFFALRDISV